MTTTNELLIEKGEITTLTLNRPSKHNALNKALIQTLTDALTTIANDTTIKLLRLNANGHNFCAGADLNWMRDKIAYSEKENYEDADKLATLFHTLYTLPQPTLALVQGAALGGGAGLVACCDLTLANEDAYFAFPEARLGLIPATIAPYVIRAIGPHTAKRLFITGETFSATKALNWGLLHSIAKSGKLPIAAEALCKKILANAPEATKKAKALVNTLCAPIDETLRQTTSQWVAKICATDEAQHRLYDFLTKQEK